MTSTNCFQHPKLKRGEMEDRVHKFFYHMILKLNLHQFIRWFTVWYKGDLLLPTNMNAKIGTPVADILLSKHP